MNRKFNWKTFIVCLALILSLTASSVSPILYFVIGNKQEEQVTTAPSWFDGEGAPDDAVGIDGDYYLDTKNGDVYQKKSSVWQLIYSIGEGDKGDQGPAGKDGTAVKTGAGNPNTAHIPGATGDLYLDTDTGDLYEMQSSGSWLFKANIKGAKGDDGNDGKDGATWQVGDKDPTQPQSDVEGKEGDFYLNSTTWNLYKKTADSWTLVGNIKGQIGETGESGQDGATWIVGTQNPQGTVTGKNGDLYLNTQTWDVYKCSGGTNWSQVGNIQGIAGPKGDAGKDGTTWKFGDGNPQGKVVDAKDGDYYLDEENFDIYRYNGSSWENVGSIKGKNGENGLNGVVWTVGSENPNNKVQGKTGDLYLNKTDWNIYRNTDGNQTWELVGSIKGTDGTQGPAGQDGKPGKDGTTWIVGTEEPNGKVSGNEGDLYLNKNDWKVYKCNGEMSWEEVGSIKGTDGAPGLQGQKGEDGKDGATWTVGSQNPQGTVSGKIGDLYLNTQDWNVYKCNGETSWELVGSIKGTDGKQGPAGKDGTIWHFGDGNPSGKELSAKDGDYYLDEQNFDIYRYEGSSWENVGSIKGKDGEDGLPGSKGDAGIDGATWKVGTGNPTGQESGKQGDLYLDTTDWTIYKNTDGEKTWTSVGSIKGKDGVQGPAGDPGKNGATWKVGETTPQGSVQGNAGDLYLDKNTWTVYECTEGTTWQELGSIKGNDGTPGLNGSNGKDGATWKVGKQDPTQDSIEGNEGDLYLNTDNWNVYKCNGGTNWEEVGSIKGLNGERGPAGKDGTTWKFGNGSPEGVIVDAQEGDYYLDEQNFDIYRYEQSAWKNVGSIKGKDGTDGLPGQSGQQGNPGKDGATWTVGEENPQDSVQGNKGDLYLNKTDWNIYRNTDGNQTWELVGSIKGTDGTQGPAGQDGKPGQDGATWTVGEENPNGTVSGKQGDLYLNKNDWKVYKCNGEMSWEEVGSIKGTDGVPGLQGQKGEDGKDGATWQVGTKDPTLEESGVEGKEGDLYLNTQNWNVYKYSGEEWEEIGSIKGTDGKQGPDGAKGEDGATWKFGSGSPKDNQTDGKSGDFYLDQDNFDVWHYGESDWEQVGNIKGTPGVAGEAGKPGENGATWQVGEKDPTQPDTDIQGKEGDFYLNSTTWNLYHKDAEGWKLLVCIKGPKGEDGTTWHFGNGDPQNAEIQDAKDGDYYLDEENFVIYRYNGSSWQNVGSIKGTDGKDGLPGSKGDAGIDGATWKVGTGNPTGQESGKQGDLYLDTTDWTIYKNTDGEKTWTSVGSIKGKDGVQGPAGAPGKNGATWKVGETTPQGSVQGNAGDLYLDKNTWTVYECTEGTTWQELGSIKGNDGTPGLQGQKGEDGKDGATWQVGEDTPVGEVTGKVGDLYLDTKNWDVYKCTEEGTNWELVGSILGKNGEKGPAGEKGEDGATWYFGTGDPTEQFEEAKNGDFYLDKSSFDVWHYGESGWQQVGNIKGEIGQQGPAGKDGITWTIGDLDPTQPQSAVEGNEGDMYLNSETFTLYKYTGEQWQELGSIKGQDGEDGQKGDKGDDGQAGKDADELYMGYDGYVWRGAERSDWYIPGATAGEDVFEHTTEVAEVMSKYFESDYVDLSSNVIALMPYYKEHIDQTLYSGMELTEITVYAKEAGKLQIGSAKVKDVIDSRTNGKELLVINEQKLDVVKGKNVIKATLHIDDDETIVLGGANSVALYFAKDIPVDDEPGNFAVIDKQSHQDLLAKTGTKYNDTLAIQVRMSLTVDVPMFEDLRQHVQDDIGGLEGLTSDLRFAGEHWGAYMYAYTGQNTNLFEGKTITRIGVPLAKLERGPDGGLPYLDMYLIPTYKDENGVTPAPDSDDVKAKRKEHSILIDNTLDRLEIKTESEYQAELNELKNGPTWVDFDCRYVVPDGYTLAFCGDGGGFDWLLAHSNTAEGSEVERLGLAKIPYYTPMNSIAGLGKDRELGTGDWTTYGGQAEPTKLLFDIYYEVEWSPAQQIDRLEELEWEATEMDRLRDKVGGKYISILGDSISTYDGYSNEYETQNKDIKNNGSNLTEDPNDHNYYGNATAYPRLASISVEDTWWMRTINQAGLKLCVNNSSAGDLVSVEAGRISSGGGRSKQLHDNTTKNDLDPSIASKNQDQEEDIYPDIVAIYFGINDFTNHINDEDGGVKEFETNYKLIVNKIMETYGSKQDFKLFVFTLFPEEGVSKDYHPTLDKFPDEENYQAALDKYNTVIRSIAQDNRKIEVVDLSRKYHLSRDEFKPYALVDSLHPNERGMRLMSNAFLEELYRVYVGK